MNSPLLDKSKAFALRVIKVCNETKREEGNDGTSERMSLLLFVTLQQTKVSFWSVQLYGLLKLAENVKRTFTTLMN